jgi:hypothetical protein
MLFQRHRGYARFKWLLGDRGLLLELIEALAEDNQRQAENIQQLRVVDVRRDIGVQLLIGTRKAADLDDGIGHWRWPRGSKGVASSGGSARDANASAMKLTGRSGLSRAARPCAES